MSGTRKVALIGGGGLRTPLLIYGLAQAREFTSVAGVTGIVLTKLDGTAKGGIAVAIANDLKLPIRYVGVGEGIDDLVPFDANEYVDGLFQEKW